VIAVIIDVGRPGRVQPLTCTRDLAACPVANVPLRHAQERRLGEAGVDGSDDGGPTLYLRGDAWVSVAALCELRTARTPVVLRDPRGLAMAWVGDSTEPADPATEIVCDGSCFAIEYPWDLLRINEELVGAISADRIEGEVSHGVTIEGCLVLGAGSRLLPGVFVEGNAVIGRGCKVGPNCYVRGNTSIGDGCHIGQAVEVKNSILMDNVGMGHLSYCGDSVIGEGTNFGAGTITANFRHDGQPHRSMVEGKLVGTGRRKFGSIIGDDVHTGIHTSIYPGRKIWPHLATRPGQVVERDLRSET